MSNLDTLLVELGTEELPPKALKKLGLAFAEGILQGLKDANLAFKSHRWYAAPRRLALQVSELELKQADQAVARKGPAVKAAYDKEGNPTKAALGFAKSCGVEIDQLETEKTDKGEWLVFHSEKKGKDSAELLPEIIQTSLNKLPIPKRMTWGNHKVAFVRPAHWLTVMLGSNLVECELLDQKSNAQTFGHRFHSNNALPLSKADDYEETLTSNYVIPNYEDRKAKILQQVLDTAKQHNGNAEIDEALLDEVCGLVEWPVALSGQFDESFLAVPSEALISAMKEHQKYFPLKDNKGQLINRFITLSNIESKDPSQVVAGNEKVIRPRLADAAFFFNTDKKMRLEDFNKRLEKVVFQKQLGTVLEKAERVSNLAAIVAEDLASDKDLAARAGLLSKADLATEMVGEFPDLQGTMGKYYAVAQGEESDVALAIEEQYKPKSMSDSLPTSKTGLAVSLAEKIDTLVGIFGINQKPTGDKDPFALRRAALGVLNMLINKEIDLEITPLIQAAVQQYGDKLSNKDVESDLLQFFLDRYRPLFQSKGTQTEVIIAVEALRPDNPLDFARRVDAVNHFSQLDGASALATANKRVANILRKSGDGLADASIDANLLEANEEKELVAALEKTNQAVEQSIANADYKKLLSELAALKEPIDQFFDHVMVNVDDEKLKQNRLAILHTIKQQFIQVADISALSRD